MEEGRKNDTGKLRFDLLPVRALEQVAEIYTYGATKYDDNNWRRGLQWGRVFGALMRHMWAFWRGEDVDEESGLPHLAHAAWGCLTLLDYMETHRELDDRAESTSFTISTPIVIQPVGSTVTLDHDGQQLYQELKDEQSPPTIEGFDALDVVLAVEL